MMALEQSSCGAHVTYQVIVKCFTLDNASKWNGRVSSMHPYTIFSNLIPMLMFFTSGYERAS